ncbi:GAF domain-containing protein [Dactylosporangium vinaceum]|uniref:GAF domain-containing protein n=1 Tax=Dactylosporangium vinaceum TaxID=53362 RepID=A0ABV5MEC2_9ACTN|nr:GAF domain-containing protein [Dactylosporangium vinaceum]UAC01067.1 GAF domain-containing protein [Dactylosporangium vinaceum]
MNRSNEKIANLGRMRGLAAYDLFNPDLHDRLQVVCRRSAGRLNVPIAAVQAVLDTATATLAASDPEHDLVSSGGGPNEFTFCPQVVLDEAPYVVDDLRDDPVHGTNPVVQVGLVRSYAGIPLRLPSGHILGAHCAMSGEAHTFTDTEIAELTAAADEVVDIIRHYELNLSAS